ncbi:hypothetical protein ALP81_200153 [Pseudomonas savastanoi pv. fraxini]|nr:hypothetical protein ALP81_200153 [Pseudomonas savastanoi pv. fraxini]
MSRISLSNCLHDWCSRWDLQGDVLACKACHMASRASQPDRPFVHGLDCGMELQSLQYPWRDLAAFMTRLPPYRKK